MKINRLLFCLLLIFCTVNLSFTQSVEINNTEIEQTKKELELSIDSLKRMRHKYDLLLEKAERLYTSDSITILQSNLNILEESQKSSKEDSLLLKNRSIESGKARDSLTNALSNNIKQIKNNSLLISEQLKKRTADTTALNKKKLEKKEAIKLIRDTINQQLAKDTFSIRTYQKTILKALDREDYFTINNNIKEIKTILSKQFYISTECQKTRKSFSNQFYTNEPKYQNLKKDIEMYEQVVNTMLKVKNTLNQKYRQADIDQSLKALRNILDLKVVKQRNNILESVEILSTLLRQYCKENNDAYELAEYIVNGIVLNEKDKRNISNLKSNYPYLYGIFRTKEDKEILFENSKHSLIEQDSCK